ncbi:MAG: BamA/TamA family outer membrane protein [Chitinophagaceae bacterium]
MTNSNKKIALYLFFIMLSVFAHAQNADTTQAPQKDIVDYLRKWVGYKPSEKADSIRPGDKPVLSILPAAGYTLQTRLAAILVGNVAFYTSPTPGSKLSVINANVNYTQNRQFTIPVQLNIWLKGNTWNLLGDWRFMKYPQSTFGLGSDVGFENEDPMDYYYVRIYQYILRKITNNFSAGVGYNLDYHWDISEQGVNTGEMSEYAKYGATRNSVSSGLSFNFLYDSRKNPINPTQGLSANVVLRNNFTWLGSNTNWQSAIIDIRKFFPLAANGRSVLGFWSYNWLVTDGKPPYLDLPSTAWDNFNNTGRGFIQGRYRGNIMLYLESEYRFTITRDGLFGAVIFGNAESFSGAPSNHLQSIQPGAGAGIRIKLNKKSNTNIAIDYGFGTQGSRGLFVNVGEVF